ncbi:hypothetical protein [Paenibacillus ehimensis]|uniref:hypothetical protein n=1 Tax=Paenibacillus ehimensis TaxID=79264 RepID=UPI00046FE754|nr:hypothetical protein [Paenibacillus ehimensis]
MNKIHFIPNSLGYPALSALSECRLSISMVGGKAVYSGYAPVRVTHLNAKEIGFISSLRIPVDKRVTVSLELIFQSGLLRLSGDRLYCEPNNGQFQYRLKYEMSRSDRSMLLSMLYLVTEEVYIEKALERYAFSQPSAYELPQINYQT